MFEVRDLIAGFVLPISSAQLDFDLVRDAVEHGAVPDLQDTDRMTNGAQLTVRNLLRLCVVVADVEPREHFAASVLTVQNVVAELQVLTGLVLRELSLRIVDGSVVPASRDGIECAGIGGDTGCVEV